MDISLVSLSAKHLKIHVCCQDGVSFRSTHLGSLPIVALRQVVAKYGAGLSLQGLVRQAQTEILDQVQESVDYDGRRYFIQMRMDASAALDQIYFKRKQARR